MEKIKKLPLFRDLYNSTVAITMAIPQTMLKGPQTRLLRLIHTPALTRQNSVSVRSPSKDPTTRIHTSL